MRPQQDFIQSTGDRVRLGYNSMPLLTAKM